MTFDRDCLLVLGGPSVYRLVYVCLCMDGAISRRSRCQIVEIVVGTELDFVTIAYGERLDVKCFTTN